MKLSSSITVRRRVVAPVTYKITASEPYIAKNADGSLKASDITIGLQKITGEKVEEMDVSLLEIMIEDSAVFPVDNSSLKSDLEVYGYNLEDVSYLTIIYDGLNNYAELTLQSVQDGAQGTSALELYTNNSLSYTTNNNGIVEDFSPSVTVKVMLGSNDVTSSCTFAVDSSATAGCTPTVTKSGSTATVKLTAIDTESVKGDDGNTYTVSRSSAVVGLSITYNGKTYKKQLPVSVSVSKMVATFKSDINGISLKYDNLTDGLSATGIDITAGKIKATANNFIIQNNKGDTTMTVDEDGNLCTTGNGTFKGNINCNGNGYFKGKVEATSGKFENMEADGITATNFKLESGTVGGFKFDHNCFYIDSATSASPAYFSQNLLVYNQTKNKRQAFIGTTDLYGTRVLARFKDTAKTTDAKVGIVINIDNGQTQAGWINDAIQINGGCVSGLNLRTQEISMSGTTISNFSNAVVLNCSKDITVYMPDFGQNMKYDGHVIMIKRWGSKVPTIQCSGNNAFFFQEDTVSQTNKSMAWNGCSATFVFFPYMTSGSYKGIWIEWRGVHAQR